MVYRICFELSTRDDNGDINNTFGLAMALNVKNQPEASYEKIAGTVKIPGLLRLACLSELVNPEDVKVITPEEYDEKYGG